MTPEAAARRFVDDCCILGLRVDGGSTLGLRLRAKDHRTQQRRCHCYRHEELGHESLLSFRGERIVNEQRDRTATPEVFPIYRPFSEPTMNEASTPYT